MNQGGTVTSLYILHHHTQMALKERKIQLITQMTSKSEYLSLELKYIYIKALKDDNHTQVPLNDKQVPLNDTQVPLNDTKVPLNGYDFKVSKFAPYCEMSLLIVT